MKTQEVNVDGFRYRVTQLTGWDGFRMSNRLLHLLEGALPHAAKLVKGGSLRDLLESEAEQLLPAVGSIIAKLSPEEQEDITRTLLSPVLVVLNGKQEPVNEVFDSHFQGRVFSAYKLVFQVIKVNFGNFGGGRGVGGTAPQSPEPSQSETLTTSSGQQSG